MGILRCLSLDPSKANFGMAKVDIDLDTLAISVIDMKLISTEKRSSKQVRKNSDDLRRCEEIITGLHDVNWMGDCRVVFAEIPSGGQSADAVLAFGMCIGMLASLRVARKPLIQVQPFETKLAAVGTKTASKQEMIEWATEQYPDAPWITHRGKATLANEHLADAVAVAWAGVKTDEFARMAEMWRSAA